MRRIVVTSFAASALAAALAALSLSAVLSTSARADFEASSRIRDIEGRREITIATIATDTVLDTLAARGTRQGYALADLDREDARLVLEKPADVGEAALLRTPPDGTERIRLRFEIVRPEKKKNGVAVVGAILLVSNPGSSGELMMDLGKRDPYRDHLKFWLSGLQATFGR
jgi:hypothetical protein